MDTLPSLTPEFSRPLSLRRLPRADTHRFAHTATPEERSAVADVLDALDVPKLRIEGQVAPSGKEGWHLSAQITATAIQSCVVTLEPVATKLSEKIERDFQPDASDALGPDGDDSVDPLTDSLDLGLIAMEALALALPDYPRKAGIDLADLVPEDPPEPEEKPNPFAALASLRDKLDKDG
jgi:uncharacterized metal-binding protein YceD (DUF177 family)